MNRRVLCFLIVPIVLSLGCSQQSTPIVELRSYPVDEMSGIITTDGVLMDDAISSDGGGSLQIVAETPTTVRLYETGDIDVEGTRLVYQARIRTDDLEGQVYLEMWCQFGDKGEYFSRALHSPITGTTGWTTQQTVFLLRKGENPDNIQLNLVIKGRGTAWVDDVRLTRGPRSL